MAVPGHYKGRHYTEWLDELDRLRKSDDDAAYERLLRGCVDATEAESRAEGFGVAPAYYERLAVFYRKRGDHDAEVAILERFAAQRHAPGVKPAKLLERLARARSRR
jgi:hypothetical protein